MLIDVRTSVAQSDRNARLHPLAMLELFEQLKSPGTGQMTLTSREPSTYCFDPDQQPFLRGECTSDAFNFLFLPERQSVGKEGIS